MLPFAGIVVVWSGNEPRLDTHRIPTDGLLVGRELAGVAPSDERISGRHAWIKRDGDGLQITDAGSRNGTYVEGRAVPGDGIRPLLPAIVRMGRTVAVVVQDIRPYENVPISKRGELVVAGSLDRIVRGIDLAAIAEDHVTIIGGGSVARRLALDYAKQIGGEHVLIDSSVRYTPIERTLENPGSIRTIVMYLGHYLNESDADAIETWLETDVKFVTILRTIRQLEKLPAALVQRLTASTLELPPMRFDEIPTMLYELVKSRSNMEVHATVIEAIWLASREFEEDVVLARFETAVARLAAAGATRIGGHDLDELWEPMHRHQDAIQGFFRRP